MEKLRVLHFADCHLRDDDQLPEKINCLDFLADYAKDELPGIIVCAGDVFDSQYVRLDSQSAKYAFDLFERLSNIAPTFIISGTPSHEGSATEVFSKISGEHPVYVATQPDQTVAKIRGKSGPAALVTCIPAFTKQYLETDQGVEGSDHQAAKLVAGMMMGFGTTVTRFSHIPHIVVGHFQVRGSKVSETQILTGVDIEVDIDSILCAQPDLVCLGHIHKAQEVYPQPAMFYSGSTQSLNWGELDEKGFYLHIIGQDDDGFFTSSEFIPTPSVKRVRVSADLTDGAGLKELDLALYSEDAETVNGAKVRFEAKIFVDEADALDADSIKDFFMSAGAKSCDVIRIRVPRVNVRASRLVQMESLRDRIAERAKIIGDCIDPGVLEKAKLLEAHPDNISEYLEGGGRHAK